MTFSNMGDGNGVGQGGHGHPDFEDIEKNTETEMDNLLVVPPPPQIFEASATFA